MTGANTTLTSKTAGRKSVTDFEKSYEERNGEGTVDMADLRMQQHLKANGYIKGASEKQIKDHGFAGSYQKLGPDAKDGFVPKFYAVTQVIVTSDYIVAPANSDTAYMCEVKGTDKLKYLDYLKLCDLEERAQMYNDKKTGQIIEVGVYYFPYPSTNKIGYYYSFQQIRDQWESNEDVQYFDEKDYNGDMKMYKVMPWDKPGENNG